MHTYITQNRWKFWLVPSVERGRRWNGRLSKCASAMMILSLLAGESNTLVVPGRGRGRDVDSNSGTRRVLRRTRSAVVRFHHCRAMLITLYMWLWSCLLPNSRLGTDRQRRAMRELLGARWSSVLWLHLRMLCITSHVHVFSFSEYFQ